MTKRSKQIKKQTKQGRRVAGICSFCLKPGSEVGLLVEAAGDVYICYACALMCKDIIEQEHQRRGIPVKEAAYNQ